MREAKLFEAKLGPIDGAGNVGKLLMQLAEGKPVVQSAFEAEAKKNGEKADSGDEEEEDKGKEGTDAS